jgi:hypothetical protein
MLQRLFLQSQHGAGVDRVAASSSGLRILKVRVGRLDSARQLSLSLCPNYFLKCILRLQLGSQLAPKGPGNSKVEKGVLRLHH